MVSGGEEDWGRRETRDLWDKVHLFITQLPLWSGGGDRNSQNFMNCFVFVDFQNK